MTDDAGHAVTQQLRALEPIFHHAEVGAGRTEFEALTSPDFWEVGASGQVYDREFVLDTLVARYARPHDDPWTISDFRVRRLEGAVWLVTYELDQNGRHSRRMTIWRRSASGWIAEYHQGTLR